MLATPSRNIETDVVVRTTKAIQRRNGARFGQKADSEGDMLTFYNMKRRMKLRFSFKFQY